MMDNCSSYVEELIRTTSYDRSTIVAMASEKFNIPEGIVEWMIV